MTKWVRRSPLYFWRPKKWRRRWAVVNPRLKGDFQRPRSVAWSAWPGEVSTMESMGHIISPSVSSPWYFHKCRVYRLIYLMKIVFNMCNSKFQSTNKTKSSHSLQASTNQLPSSIASFCFPTLLTCFWNLFLDQGTCFHFSSWQNLTSLILRAAGWGSCLWCGAGGFFRARTTRIVGSSLPASAVIPGMRLASGLSLLLTCGEKTLWWCQP